MVRLQDDFYDYVNGGMFETAVIPDDKPSTGGFMDLIKISKTVLDITGKWQGKVRRWLKLCQNTWKMVAGTDARKQLVWPSCALDQQKWAYLWPTMPSSLS